MSRATKYVFFIAETKGSLESLQLRPIERAKIDCAKKLFQKLGDGNLVYDVVDDYDTLLAKVMR